MEDLDSTLPVDDHDFLTDKNNLPIDEKNSKESAEDSEVQC